MKHVKLITLPKVIDRRGNLTYIEQLQQIPFEIKRIYWIYDVPGGEVRGGHAYKTLHEFIVALSGSFDVVLDDGRKKRIISLNRSYNGVYVPKMIWRQLENFSTNALAIITASDYYNANDYLRDYENYLKLKNI